MFWANLIILWILMYVFSLLCNTWALLVWSDLLSFSWLSRLSCRNSVSLCLIWFSELSSVSLWFKDLCTECQLDEVKEERTRYGEGSNLCFSDSGGCIAAGGKACSALPWEDDKVTVQFSKLQGLLHPPLTELFNCVPRKCTCFICITIIIGFSTVHISTNSKTSLPTIIDCILTPAKWRKYYLHVTGGTEAQKATGPRSHRKIMSELGNELSSPKFQSNALTTGPTLNYLL